MKDFGRPWAVAGGWALDLFLGFQTRSHADVDIAIRRADQHKLHPRLAGSQVAKVVAGQLLPWATGEFLAAPVHELHAEWSDGRQLEFLLNEFDRDSLEWVYRRDHRVRRPLDLVFRNASTTPYLAPEIVLLYKSKAPSPKDEADFNTVLPHLTSEQRAWLAQALGLFESGHRWADIVMKEP
jgi:hypothetical protein